MFRIDYLSKNDEYIIIDQINNQTGAVIKSLIMTPEQILYLNDCLFDSTCEQTKLCLDYLKNKYVTF